jgi:hypothetical protein
MKSIIKLVLVVILFNTTIFAEGEMGNGTRACQSGQTTCRVASDPTNDETSSTESESSVITVVQKYIESVFEYFENQL